jgi:integrase
VHSSCSEEAKVSVAVRPFRKKLGKYQVDIIFHKPDGERVRDQRVLAAKSEGIARRWGEARESQLRAGTLVLRPVEKSPVMTVAAFAPEFLAGHLTANLAKQSSTDSVESILRVHILPFIGEKPLDQITNDVVAFLKAKWSTGGYTTPDGKRKIKPTESRKTLNNRLSVLGSMLKIAMEWGTKSGLEMMPCTVRLLKVDNQRLPGFYDHADYERLVEGARCVDPRVHALVLLAGDGGLRRGECIGLNLSDVDFKNARMNVCRAIYIKKGKRYENDVKGLFAKPVPLTERLLEALKACRHLRGERVLYTDDGQELTPKLVRMWVERAERKAGLPVTGKLHVLRHTFASHAAMAGVPARTIQELARHATMAVTMRYMHLSPSALDAGIDMLARSRKAGGTVVEDRGFGRRVV